MGRYRNYAGVARASLRIRAVALVLEAGAWILLGLRGVIADGFSILLANGTLLISYALTVRALRMLLGVPRRLVLVAGSTVAGWVGVVGFTEVVPDFWARVLCVSVVILRDPALLIVPLAGSVRPGVRRPGGCC